MRTPIGDAETSAPAQSSEAALETLTGRASAALNRQCRAARQELKQTRELLTDAARKLLDAFHAATRELAAMQAAASDGATAGDREAAARASQRLLAASQHLQFSDLVGQLVASTEHRVAGMLRVSEELRALVQALEAARCDEVCGESDVEHSRQALLDAVMPLESGGNSRVRQSNLQAGEVDLF